MRRTVGFNLRPRATVFYRTGLPVRSCLALPDALAGHAAEFAGYLRGPVGDHDVLLLALATRVAPGAPELHAWADLEYVVLHEALRQWMDRAPVDQIAAAHPDAWETVADDLDSFLPWILILTVRCLLVGTDLTTMRDVVHARLGISRLRYGVPVLDCCVAALTACGWRSTAIYSRQAAGDQPGPHLSPRISPSRP